MWHTEYPWLMHVHLHLIVPALSPHHSDKFWSRCSQMSPKHSWKPLFGSEVPLLRITFSVPKLQDMHIINSLLTVMMLWGACLPVVVIRKCITKSFNWRLLSTFPFLPLLFVCGAQRNTLPWHLSAFFIWCFIMWPFSTLWVYRYNFFLYSWFYGCLCCLLHPEGLLPQKVIVSQFVSWLSLKEVNRLESGHLKSLICIHVILDMQIQVIFIKKIFF